MPKKNKPEELKSWVVTIMETVVKEYVTVPCTKHQAETEPFSHNETAGEEVDLISWEVTDVVENK